MRGIEIAKELQISTSALRHYESWGIVPRAERSANGYRNYTAVHKAYFQCIRAMNPGFGMELIRVAMPLVMADRKLDVLWLINKSQVNLFREKETVQKTVDMLGLDEWAEMTKYPHHKWVTIGEAAQTANVSASAIRHWEKEGLLAPERNQESGFRIYSPADMRRVLIIRTVQSAAYSLDIVREVLSELDKNNAAQAKEMALQSLHYIENRLVEQLTGLAALHHLFETIACQEGRHPKP